MSVNLLNRAVEAAVARGRIGVRDLESFASVVRRGGGVSPDELAAFQAIATRFGDRFEPGARARLTALASGLAQEPKPPPAVRPAAASPSAAAAPAPADVRWTDFSVAPTLAAVAGPQRAQAASVTAALAAAVTQGVLPEGDELLLASAVAQLKFGEAGVGAVLERLEGLSPSERAAFTALRGALDTPLKRTSLYAAFSAGSTLDALGVFARAIAPWSDARVEQVLRSNGSEHLAAGPAPTAPERTSAPAALAPPARLDAAASAQVAAVLESEGFGALTASEQQRLRALISGANAFISAPARKALDALVRQADFVTVSAPTQAEALRKVLRDEAYLAGTVGYFWRGAPVGTAPELQAPVEVPGHLFIAKSATVEAVTLPAKRHGLSLDGRTVPIFVAQQALAAGEVQRTPEAVGRALAALPRASRDLVKAVNLHAGQNPHDVHWEKTFATPGFRSVMTASAEGIIDLYPMPPPGEDEAQLVAGLVHETGHVLSRGTWGASQNDPRWFPWKAAAASDGISPSGYGRENWLEDFSEAFLLRELVRGAPEEPEVRAMMPARQALIEQLLENRPS